MASYDYIIIGSGIAGLYSALLAKQVGSVLVLTKGAIDECNTKHAQGGIAAAIGSADSPDLHFKDTIGAGAGLCDPAAVRILVNEAADRINDLISFGVPFDTMDGQIALAKEGAHSAPRVLHAGGDATGARIELTLSSQVRAADIAVLEQHLVTEIATEKGAVAGVRVIDLASGLMREFACRHLIVATGGAGQLFKINTNPDVATGDGIALGFRAGAEVVDVEFLQFHPTALHLPGAPHFLISEAVRGEGGILLNAAGERFMPRYDSRAELASRDLVTRAIRKEMDASGHDSVYLDVTHLEPLRVTTRFPSIYQFCLNYGLDITSQPIPVAPAAHYIMGGLRTNIWGETNVKGLYACGECACTGVHGANRLASNSLLEVLIFSKRIIARTMGRGETRPAAEPAAPTSPLVESTGDLFTDLTLTESLSEPVPEPSIGALQDLMWEKVGISRSGEKLREAQSVLSAWHEFFKPQVNRADYELGNMILVAKMMADAALMREESRGAHFRTDFAAESPQWERHIVFRRRAQQACS